MRPSALRAIVLSLLIVPLATRDARAQMPDIPSAQDLLGSAVSGLASSLEEKGKEKILGLLLSATGLESDGPTLTDVKNELDQIQDQLATIEDTIQKADAQLLCGVEFGNYNTLIAAHSTAITDVKAFGGALNTFVQATADGKTQEAAALKAQLIANLGSNLDLASRINAMAVGDPDLGNRGAIKLYSRALTSCRKFFNSDSSARVARQWDYLALLQANACTLMVNYFMSQGEPDQAEKTVQDCQDYVSALNGLKVQDAVTEPELIDTTTNTMWYVGKQARNHCFHIKNGCVVNLASLEAGYDLPNVSDVQTLVQPCSSDSDHQGCLTKIGVNVTIPQWDGHIIFWARNPAAADIYHNALNQSDHEANGISHYDMRTKFDPLKDTRPYCVTAFTVNATGDDYFDTPCTAVHASGKMDPFVGFLNPGPQVAYVLLQKANAPVNDGQYYWF